MAWYRPSGASRSSTRRSGSPSRSTRPCACAVPPRIRHLGRARARARVFSFSHSLPHPRSLVETPLSRLPSRRRPLTGRVSCLRRATPWKKIIAARVTPAERGREDRTAAAPHTPHHHEMKPKHALCHPPPLTAFMRRRRTTMTTRRRYVLTVRTLMRLSLIAQDETSRRLRRTIRRLRCVVVVVVVVIVGDGEVATDRPTDRQANLTITFEREASAECLSRSVRRGAMGCVPRALSGGLVRCVSRCVVPLCAAVSPRLNKQTKNGLPDGMGCCTMLRRG